MAPTASYAQLYGRRFSEDEQMAFGRFAHLNVRNHFSETTSGTLRPRRASEPNLRASEPNLRASLLTSGTRTRDASQNSSVLHSPVDLSLAATPVGPSPRAVALKASASFDQYQLRSVLQQLLPAEEAKQNVASPTPASRSRCDDTTPPTRRHRQNTSAGGDGCTQPSTRRRREATPSVGAEGCATPLLRSRSAAVLGGAESLKASRPVRSRKQVLEHFRWRLFQRFRSLFDAFERLHDLATRENALSQEEFCQAFAQLGVKESEARETFLAIDRKGKELVSLAELRIALAGTSKHTLLWELRCRLLTQGITPNDFSKVKKILEIARRPRHRTVRQRRQQPLGRRWPGQMVAAGMPEGHLPEASMEESEADWGSKFEGSNWVENCDTSMGFLPSSSRLSRLDWLQICAAIGLTIVEAERLFTILAEGGDMVDFKEMFTILRADAPHVSLERFATRTLTRYGSLQSAFAASLNGTAAVARGKTQLMHWPEFHSLAVILDVRDSNAEQLWATLTSAQRNQRENTNEEGGAVSTVPRVAQKKPAEGKAAKKDKEEEIEGVTELIFVKELTMWAPGTALCALRNQVDEHFSDLGELRHALGQTGSVLSAPVTPAELDSALLAVGIPGCNVERVCKDVQSAWRGGLKGGSISLDDVVEALHSNSSVHGSAAQSAVRDDLRPFWQKLHNMQADLFGEEEHFKEESPRLPCPNAPKQLQLMTSSSLPSLRSSTRGLRTRASRHLARSRRGAGSSCAVPAPGYPEAYPESVAIF